MSTRQVGLGLVSLNPPVFQNYELVDNTWQEKDALQVEASRGGTSNMVNYTGWSPGVDAQGDWWVKQGCPRAHTLDIITEGILVLATGNPVAGTTIIIGEVTYTFEAAIAATANLVVIGATVYATLANLIGAITAADTGGQAPGTTYGVGTVVNPQATAIFDPASGGIDIFWTSAWSGGAPFQVSGTSAVLQVADTALNALAAPLLARTFVVPEAPDTKSYGGRKLKQSVKLAYHADGFQPVAVATS